MSSEYSPLDGLKRVRKAMDGYVKKHTPANEQPLTLSVNKEPVPCSLFLASFIDGGPMPDDFKALPKTSEALKAHVRPDGGVYKGAYELQGTPGSVILMYGPANLTAQRAEKIANMERLALTKRHESFRLGPFSAQPVPSSRPARA